MAFPQKVSATPTVTTFTSAATAHAANMPASVSAGGLLFALIAAILIVLDQMIWGGRDCNG